MIYLILSTLFCLAGTIIIYWLHHQDQLDIVVRPAPPPAAGPLISICVPARDEEHNIRACLEAILVQTYPNTEVIVLEDRSSDNTAAILQDLSDQHNNLKILNGSTLPAGWAGKPYALSQAEKSARGEWLCFIDADTFLIPKTISSCYSTAIETGADLFTIMTEQITVTFWEKTVMPLVLTALSVGFPARKVNDPRQPDAIANGQFIMIKRSVYDAIGGHESVKDKIVEDKAISERVKWNGYRLIVADGSQVARTRMYTSLPQMWEGWTKNIYLGLRDQPSLLGLGVFGVVVSVISAIFLPLWPLIGLLWYFHGGGWPAITVVFESLLVWVVLLSARATVAGKMDISRWYAFTTPLGTGIFTAMMLTSAWNVVSGRGVTWRGRKYQTS
jgi:chlorobactene glucosyltransferase